MAVFYVETTRPAREAGKFVGYIFRSMAETVDQLAAVLAEHRVIVGDHLKVIRHADDTRQVVSVEPMALTWLVVGRIVPYEHEIVGEVEKAERDPTKDVLLVPMGKNDAGAETVGDYLRTLLATLWSHEQGFNGKRPFGNSGWQSEVYGALIAAGIVKGNGALEDDCGYPVDRHAADELILSAIAGMGVKP